MRGGRRGRVEGKGRSGRERRGRKERGKEEDREKRGERDGKMWER